MDIQRIVFWQGLPGYILAPALSFEHNAAVVGAPALAAFALFSAWALIRAMHRFPPWARRGRRRTGNRA